MNTVMMVILGLLMAADFETTKRWLAMGGSEGNPVMRWIYGRWGLKGMYLTGLGAYALFWAFELLGWMPRFALVALICGWAAVVGWNLSLIFKKRNG